jgi:hypothetical protein
MHPSQTMFSGEVSKKEASPSLSGWSLFLIAANIEHTLQYIPHGDRYSFFTLVFSSSFLSSGPKETKIAILSVSLYGLCRSALINQPSDA